MTADSSTSVSLKAITAPVLTAALDLAIYENGWDGKSRPTNYPDNNTSENTLSYNTTTVTANGKYVIVQFPGKAYLNYEVTDYFGNVLKNDEATLIGAKTFVNNALRTYHFIPAAAGSHSLKIVASPYNKAYYTTSAEITKIVTTTANLSSWTSSIAATWDDNSAWISFKPNPKYETSFDTSKYTVYRYSDGTYTALTSSVSVVEDTTGIGIKFAVTDTEPSKIHDSKYYVVLTVGKESVAAYDIASLDATSYVSPVSTWNPSVNAVWNSDSSAVFVSFYPAEEYNNVSNYKVSRYVNGKAEDVTLLGEPSADITDGKFYYSDSTALKSVDYVYVVTFSDGIKTKSVKSDVVSAKSVTEIDTFSVTTMNLDDEFVNDLLITLVTKDDITDNEITVYKTTYNNYTSSVDYIADSKWKKVTDLTWDNYYSGYETTNRKLARKAYIKDSDSGNFIYKVEVTRSGYASASKYSTVTVDAQSVADSNLSVYAEAVATYFSGNTYENSSSYNNIAVTVTDSLDTDETLSDFTYKVSYATLKDGYTTNGFKFNDWSEEQTVTMVSIPEVSSTAISGTYLFRNRESGTYAIRVTKTNKQNKTVYAYSFDSSHISATEGNQTTLTNGLITIHKNAVSASSAGINETPYQIATVTGNHYGQYKTAGFYGLNFDVTVLSTGTEISITYKDFDKNYYGTNSGSSWASWGSDTSVHDTLNTFKNNYEWKLWKASDLWIDSGKTDNSNPVETLELQDITPETTEVYQTVRSTYNVSTHTWSMKDEFVGYKTTLVDSTTTSSSDCAQYYVLTGKNKDTGYTIVRTFTIYPTSETIQNSAKEITVYDSANYKVSAENGYTIISNGDVNEKWYKFATVSGEYYRVNLVNASTYDDELGVDAGTGNSIYYTTASSVRLNYSHYNGYASIYCQNEDSTDNVILSDISNTAERSFIGDGRTVYLRVKKDNSGKIAFRVWKGAKTLAEPYTSTNRNVIAANGYTIVSPADFSGTNGYEYYQIPTESGTKYSINWVTMKTYDQPIYYDSYGNAYSYSFNGSNLTTCELYLYDDKETPLSLYNANGSNSPSYSSVPETSSVTEYTFTANSPTTYIKIGKSDENSNSGKVAFRIRKYNIGDYATELNIKEKATKTVTKTNYQLINGTGNSNINYQTYKLSTVSGNSYSLYFVTNDNKTESPETKKDDFGNDFKIHYDITALNSNLDSGRVYIYGNKNNSLISSDMQSSKMTFTATDDITYLRVIHPDGYNDISKCVALRICEGSYPSWENFTSIIYLGNTSDSSVTTTDISHISFTKVNFDSNIIGKNYVYYQVSVPNYGDYILDWVDSYTKNSYLNTESYSFIDGSIIVYNNSKTEIISSNDNFAKTTLNSLSAGTYYIGIKILNYNSSNKGIVAFRLKANNE